MYIFQTKKADGTPHARWRFQYTDWTGKRRTGTGLESKKETLKIASRTQAEHDAIRKGWAPAPQLADKIRDFKDAVEEYLAWGAAQGGRGGRPWGPWHLHKRKTQLEWWRQKLEFASVQDLVGALPNIESALRAILDSGKTGKTVQHYAESLKAFAEWCKRRGYLRSNPLDELQAFNTTPQKQRRALTHDEIQLLIANAPQSRLLGYKLALATGLRVRELNHLTWGHVDFTQGGLRLDAAWTKNRREGFQPVPEALMNELLTSKGKADARIVKISTNASRLLRTDLVNAGLPKWSVATLDFHCLRVTYITLIVASGADLKTAQVLARHASPSMTMNVYAKASSSRLKETAEIVGQDLIAEENTISTQRLAVGSADILGSLSTNSTYAISEGLHPQGFDPPCLHQSSTTIKPPFDFVLFALLPRAIYSVRKLPDP